MARRNQPSPVQVTVIARRPRSRLRRFLIRPLLFTGAAAGVGAGGFFLGKKLGQIFNIKDLVEKASSPITTSAVVASSPLLGIGRFASRVVSGVRSPRRRKFAGAAVAGASPLGAAIRTFF